MKLTEHRIQAGLFKWFKLASARHPELALLFAIPNGGARDPITGAMLKAEGVKRGVPDLFLPSQPGSKSKTPAPRFRGGGASSWTCKAPSTTCRSSSSA